MHETKRNSGAADNWGIIGHEWAVDFLRRSLIYGRQRHAYLFVGSASLGKMTLAQTFAMALNCEDAQVARRPCRQCRACQAISRGQDPDLILVQQPAGAPLKIGAVREVSRLLALKPYAARYRIAIFDNFDAGYKQSDRIAPPAQDALLKTLEEPVSYAVLILLASALERVLPTIRSRAQTLQLRPAPQQRIKAQLLARGCAENQADLIARLSGGRVGWALAALEDESPLEFRAQMLDRLRDVVKGTRLLRLKAAAEVSQRAAKDKAMLRAILECWQSYWRDLLLQCYASPVKPCNIDRHEEIRALAGRLDPAQARVALQATSQAMRALDTNANTRLLLDALFLDYPLL